MKIMTETRKEAHTHTGATHRNRPSGSPDVELTGDSNQHFRGSLENWKEKYKSKISNISIEVEMMKNKHCS